MSIREVKLRIELEQRIMECWNVVEDIKAVHTAHQDLHELSVDEMANTLMGIQHLYQIKFELLFDTFEKHLKATHEESSAVDYKLKLAEEVKAERDACIATVEKFNRKRKTYLTSDVIDALKARGEE
jgi:hypothetical protein